MSDSLSDPARPIIDTPASYITLSAVAFADEGGRALRVDRAQPLPVEPMRGAAIPPLTGSTEMSGVYGPFAARPARPLSLSLSGDWKGMVRLVQSRDDGVTFEPLTLGGAPWATFTKPVNEPVWEPVEDGLSFFIDATLSGGTLTYRVSQ